MSEWAPKVGDKVMVGEHGPYLVTNVAAAAAAAHLNTEITAATWVPFDWLTPAPEPEPDEPTAFGALVRDGDGRLWVRSPIEGSPDSPAWDALDRLSSRWISLPRPITVVLADPAEVERLRERADQLEQLVVDMDTTHDELVTERDELQRRINTALALTGPRDRLYDTWLTQGAILRGES